MPERISSEPRPARAGTAAREAPAGGGPAPARAAALRARRGRLVGPTVVEEEAAFLVAGCGPHVVAFALGDVRALDAPDAAWADVLRGARARHAPVAVRVDLRAAVGAAPAPGAPERPADVLECARAGSSGVGDAEGVEVLVDRPVRLVRAPLARVHPLPWPLDRLPGLGFVRGVVALEDPAGLALLVDPARLGGAAAAEAGA